MTAVPKSPNRIQPHPAIRAGSLRTQRQFATGPRDPGHFGARTVIHTEAATRLNFRTASQATSARSSAARIFTSPMR